MQVIMMIEDREAAELANKMTAEWLAEHASYYGRPHGIKSIMHHLEWVRCGCTEVAVSYPGNVGRSMIGYRWMTCGGNDHRIAVTGNRVIAAYDGRRHGMHPDFREFLQDFWGYDQAERVYLSTEPTWLPWQTKDMIHEIAMLEDYHKDLIPG